MRKKTKEQEEGNRKTEEWKTKAKIQEGAFEIQEQKYREQELGGFHL